MKKEAAAYFQRDPGYSRLFKEMIRKVKRHGRIGGEVILKELSNEEVASISSFFRCDVPTDSYSVSLLKFEAMLLRSAFGSVSLKELLDEYAGEEIISNKSARENKRNDRVDFFQKLSMRFDDANSKAILESLPGSFLRMYEERGEEALQDFEPIFIAFSQLPVEGYERLPVFSERVAGDPHAFDGDRYGRLLTDGLKVLFEALDSVTLEEEVELYAAAGLLKDDVHNFVSASGLNASNFSYWEQAHTEGAILNVPLREVIKLDSVSPIIGSCVFVVENSGVFSALLDQFTDVLPPLVCLHGQPKLSSLLLLDKLVKGGSTLFYSGDFDPEGLLICERLWKRFGDRLVPWRMSKEDYEFCKTHVPLSPRRLSMLKNIQHPILGGVKERILYNEKVGYQEKLLRHLIQDILKK
ncbi:TIGR02679 family protein [Paenibacillus sp. yr247]|uniref:TIGR02679 family protein n=1 Tax=Paenibacillus sp. yr247 TaxID=1761880 RepID=UPI00087F482F|nr:TIGR02679 family protein [Paenibacillus sp. yr247]SDN61533.1 TIGR02679 family protein [Paenibacillus sp. yr247]